MRKKLIALTALAIALSAPGAAAATGAVAAVDCRFSTISEETLTRNDTFTGMAYGYVVSDAGETVTIRCEVRVDGGSQDSTDPGSGTGLAVTGGQVIYTATDTQDVDLCAIYTVNGGPETSVCGATTTIAIPPQEMLDLSDSVSNLLAELANSFIRCVTAVNLGTCNSGICIVNTGTCDGGICLVNTGYCRSGCIAGVNLDSCGHRQIHYGS